MRPIRTTRTNFSYLHPGGPAAGDPLPCRRADLAGEGTQLVVSVWEFTPQEREAIARGQNLELHVHMQPPPPVGMTLTHLTEEKE